MQDTFFQWTNFVSMHQAVCDACHGMETLWVYNGYSFRRVFVYSAG